MTPDGKKKLIGIYERRPCRRCKLCKIDRQNYWEDRLEYEHIQKVSSAFVTFTYDAYRCPIGKTGNLTLEREEIKQFIDRLQAQTRYHGVPSNLCKKDWTYYGVGEYGGKFGRPHYHILFFGLDFWDSKKLFESCWQKGIIDSLPILGGGIRYVLKYIDKQLWGDLAQKTYGDNYIQEPYWSASKGIGSGLFYSQYERIVMTGNYINIAGKERPAPQYYKTLFGYTDVQTRIDEKIRKFKEGHKNGNLEGDYDKWESELLYARDRLIADRMLLHGEGTILENYEPQRYGAVRNMMYKEFEKGKIRECDTINRKMLELLYEHRGELL